MKPVAVLTCILAVAIKADFADAADRQTSAALRVPLVRPIAATTLRGRNGKKTRGPRHLYVVSRLEGAVYSFPVTNGLPAKAPDAEITGLVSPFGVAVDAAGYLYVSDEGTYTIDVFAPGSTGNAKPVRQIIFPPGHAPFILVLEGSNVLTAPADCCIGVFPTSQNGYAAPLAQLPLIEGSGVLGMAADEQGTFYAAEVDRGIYVYPNLLPIDHQSATLTYPSRSFYPSNPYKTYSYGLAVSDGLVYVRQDGVGRYVLIDVVPSTANGPTTPLRMMETAPCGPRLVGLMYSLAIYGNYLYEACEDPIVAVLIYNKNGRGTVRPLFRLRGPFQSADQITLGP